MEHGWKNANLKKIFSSSGSEIVVSTETHKRHVKAWIPYPSSEIWGGTWEGTFLRDSQ